ncbi:MAG: sugar phosphate isomerase/epimerase family protein [Bacteroidota bacterium]
MPTLLLNTIALEPNRWTSTKQPHRPLEVLLPRLAEAGFNDLEIWQHHVSTLGPAARPRIAEAFQRHGLQAHVIGWYPAFHTQGNDAAAQRSSLDEAIQWARALGAGFIKVFPGAVAYDHLSQADRERSIDALRRFTDRAADAGLVVTAETHENTLADSVEHALDMLARVGHPALQLCFQPLDLADTEQAIEDFDRLAPHVAHLHIQGRRNDAFAPLRQSDLNWPHLLQHISATGFTGPVCLEFVAGCVSETPETLDLNTVLQQARDDWEVLERWL